MLRHRRVLAGVDLEVHQGEIMCLLGPNGAGKTTMVEILEGFREATSGSVHVFGLDPSAQPRTLRERVGVVFQETGFPRHLRVRELIEAWRSYFPAPMPLADLLEIVELADSQSVLASRLSGGQQRRLDFTLALAGDPDLIFLDEPTTGFDPEARRRLWETVEELRLLGKTILLTTHYLDEAQRLADRVAILAGGQVRALGTVRELAKLSDAPSRVTFTRPDTLDESLGVPGDLVVDIDAGLVSGTAPDAFDAVRCLVESADQAGLATLEDLEVVRPTLEDTYLQLVGTEAEASR